MRLLEYQAMKFFGEYSIPAPGQVLVEKEEDLEKVSLPFPVVLKAQVAVGGRGKAGGVQLASNEEELREKARQMLQMQIKGIPVRKILVVEAQKVVKEFYLSFLLDRKHMLLFLASPSGGVDIEEVAAKNPELIYQRKIDTWRGFSPFEGKIAAKFLGLSGELISQFSRIAFNLFQLLREKDMQLAEINPLALTPQGLVALDGKLIFDDNAYFRHPEMPPDESLTELEKEAKEVGVAYVEMDGDVAVIGCGAGLVLASLDLVNHLGARPANFLDLGGGASSEMVKRGMEIVLRNPRVKSIFMNIFAGITRCDEIARGIVDFAPKIPISVRMTGTNEEEGIRILKEAGYEAFSSMEEAAGQAVLLRGKGGN
ncbi:MAG: ADP-forming succinate--CoA ligase subunit beta [Coprothermobacterota bacterium]|nr:ADP-forming succinate--CoA ligase subunit beta [Coprothermobacterota bacterium]